MSPQDRFLCGLLLPIAALTLAACPGTKDICAHHDCPSNYTCEWGFPDDCERETGCEFVPTCVCLYGTKDQGGSCVDACALDSWAEKATFGCTALTGADLAGVDLTGGIFYDAELQGADLSGAILVDTILSGADLTGANLEGADLTNAYMADANLTDADLTEANLTSTYLHQARVGGADFTDATLTWLSTGDLVDCPASLPAAWRCLSSLLIGPSADLVGVDLTSADLTGMDLTDANFTHVDLTGANLQDANLTQTYWSSSTCPDGTSSDAHDDTCCGHLGEAIASAGCD